MKKLAVLLLALSVSTASFALPFVKFGAKFGIDTEKMNYESNITGLQNILADPSTGYHAGLMVRVNVPLLPVFAQGELLYNWNNANIPAQGNYPATKLKTNSFGVPIMVGVRFGLGDIVGLRLQAGPVFNLTNNVKLDGWNIDQKYMDAFKKQSVTWTAGVGVDLFSLMVDARYNGAFKKNSETISIGNVNAKPTSWSVSIGYIF